MDKKPLIIIFLTVFIDLVGFGIIIPLNPFLARQFGADPIQVGLLMTIYSLLQFMFSPFWGQLSDRWGRRPVILLSLLGASIAHLLFGFAHGMELLFISRGLAGLFGGNISAAMAYIADVTPAKDRAKGMGLIGAAFGLGFVLGPLIGGVFATIGAKLGSEPPLGGSFPALIAAAICFANFLFAWTSLKESNPRLTGHNEVVLPKRLPRFRMLAKYIRQPGVGILMIIYFLSTLAMAHMEASLFMFMQDKFGWSMAKSSMGFGYVGIIMVITQGYIIRKTLPIWGEGRSMVAGLFLATIGFAGIALSPNIPLLAVVVTFLALGTGFSNPAITGSISLLASKDEQGGTMGVNQSLSALGRIIGPALGGIFYKQLGMGVPFLVAGGLGLTAAVMSLAVLKKIPAPAAGQRHS